MLMLTVVGADPVELQRELHDLQQLRERIVESLSFRLQGPRQRQLLRVNREHSADTLRRGVRSFLPDRR